MYMQIRQSNLSCSKQGSKQAGIPAERQINTNLVTSPLLAVPAKASHLRPKHFGKWRLPQRDNFVLRPDLHRLQLCNSDGQGDAEHSAL